MKITAIFLLYCFLITGACEADSIIIDSQIYEDVYVTESQAGYIICLPLDGTTKRVDKSQVNKDSVIRSSNRGKIFRLWEERSNMRAETRRRQAAKEAEAEQQRIRVRKEEEETRARLQKEEDEKEVVRLRAKQLSDHAREQAEKLLRWETEKRKRQEAENEAEATARRWRGVATFGFTSLAALGAVAFLVVFGRPLYTYFVRLWNDNTRHKDIQVKREPMDHSYKAVYPSCGSDRITQERKVTPSLPGMAVCALVVTFVVILGPDNFGAVCLGLIILAIFIVMPFLAMLSLIAPDNILARLLRDGPYWLVKEVWRSRCLDCQKEWSEHGK